MRSTACTSIAMDHPHLQRLQELRKFWGDAMLTEKRIAKWALKHKYFYKTWIWDERWEMELEGRGGAREEGERSAEERTEREESVEREESAEEREARKRKMVWWSEEMENTREKSARKRERTEMERAGDERAWEANERDRMEFEDEREERGIKPFRREGGAKGWSKRRQELKALRQMWKGWHSSK